MINFFALVCKKYHKFTKYGLILYLLDPKARAKRYGQFLLDFLKITNNGIVCLATFIDCHTSLICGEKKQRWQRAVTPPWYAAKRRNAGREPDEAVGLCLGVKQEKKNPYDKFTLQSQLKCEWISCFTYLKKIK